MAATCPNGHQSATDDYCDTCGAPIGGASTPSPAAGSVPAGSPVVGSPPAGFGPSGSGSPVAGSGPGGSGAGGSSGAGSPRAGQSGPQQACPHCGAENAGDALFCEDCGYDFTTGQAPAAEQPLAAVPDPAAAPTGWEVEVGADRDWYAVKATADTDPFPTDPQMRTVVLRGHVAMIGRESASRGIHPDIDAGDDSAVSRRHAQLVHSGDEWQVVDLGSTNGTTIARAGQQPDADPLASGQPVTLADGDSVLVGAWTRITLRRAPAASSPRA